MDLPQRIMMEVGSRAHRAQWLVRRGKLKFIEISSSLSTLKLRANLTNSKTTLKIECRGWQVNNKKLISVLLLGKSKLEVWWLDHSRTVNYQNSRKNQIRCVWLKKSRLMNFLIVWIRLPHWANGEVFVWIISWSY